LLLYLVLFPSSSIETAPITRSVSYLEETAGSLVHTASLWYGGRRARVECHVL